MTSGIIVGYGVIAPSLTGNFAAFSLTCAIAVFIGLKIALPPLDPEDDWVQLGARKKRAKANQALQATGQVYSPVAEQPKKTVPVPPLQPATVHARHGSFMDHIWNLRPGHHLHHRRVTTPGKRKRLHHVTLRHADTIQGISKN